MTAKRVKRMLAFLMAGIITFTSAVPMQQNSVQVQAASVYENENMLVNPNFDGSEEFSPAGGSHRGNWFSWQGPTKTQEEYRSGTTSAKLEETGASLEQDVAGLVEGMTYEFKVWAKLSGSGSGSHYIGVKNYGGAEIKQKVNSTEWKEYTLEFTYSGIEDARVYCWIENAGGVTCYLDDASLTAKGDIQRVSVSNGQVQVIFAEDYVGNISKEQFSAYYKSSVDPEVAHTVEFTAGSVDGKTLTLSYDAVEAVPILQTITFNLTYASGGQTGGRSFVLDYTVEASGEERVDADIAKVTAVNGEINVLLTQNPTIKPIAQDFVWQYKIGDGEFEDLNIDEFSYVAETRTVIVKFAQLHGILEQDSVVTVKVTYGENTTSAEFALPASQRRTFYVSAEGNDNNAGTSEDAPIQSIDKLNTMTFYPGDQILFRKGDTFVGCFKPMGSGNEEHPITIGSYGEGNKPVLRPGEDFKVPYLMSANALVQNPTVNYVIWFYNVEYWEVSDLELEDPKHEQTYQNPGDVYRSGITIQAEDAGTLEHIYVDHMEIHGFHGPHTNIGKSSGGITMNIITDLDLTSGGRRKGENSVPTQINDIRITNCEIYNVGRSGINFLTPWSFREGEKWGPFDYGTRGFDYLPYEDFYMGNNYIHDIDGDGTIIDNCADAVSEYNLVTRCVLNTNGAAVGMFNWNSDRTTFQYNEVFDIRYGTNDSNHLNDSQGIEIDALNDGTLVQYNYVHDNTGGFMMLCNIGDQYRSFDGIIRYNISQNDYAHPRQGLFDIYEANWGTEVYNNNFYLTERALSTSGYGSHVNAGELFLFSAVGSRDTMKFYNNIFYYAGETPATVNTFGDDAIDWQSNIFYNFANMPTDDNAKAPNLAVDPMWNNPGAGATGTYADGKENLGYQTDLSCYYLKEGSPALNAGVQVEDNGGKDYFGNPVEGLVDIGAYESGSIALKVLSDKYAIDQSAKNITVKGIETTVAQFLSKLISEKDVVLSVKREDVTLSDDTIVEDGDTLVVSYGKEAVSYTILVKEEIIVTTENLNHVRAAKMSVSSVEVSQFGASNANDGDTSTRWSSRSVTANTNAQEWIKAEFEELTQIKHVKIKFHTRNVDPSPNNVSDFTIKYVDRDGVEQIAKANCTVAASGNNYATEVSIVLDNAIVAKAIKICDLNVKIGSTQYNSVGITELEAYSNEILPGAIVSLTGLVESLEGIQNGVIENGIFTLPEVPERFTIKLNGADFEQILGKDLTVVQPLTDKEIKVSYEVSDGTETKVTNDITYLVKGKNTQAVGKNAKPVVIPEIQEWYSDSTEKLSANVLTKVTYNDDSLSAVVDEFIADYKDFTGVALTKVKGEAQSGAFNFTKAAPDALLGEEGYTMHILSDRINVASESITGNMYGMQTILQMSKKDATGFAIGQMRDYPRFEVRGFMLDIARKPVAMEIINEIARTMRYYKMNDFQLHLSDNYIWLENYGVGETENEAFKAYEAFRLECDVTNAAGESPTAKDYFITKDDMRTFIQSQRALGMNIVPEIDLPAHATSFTKIWPELMAVGEVNPSNTARPLVDHFDIRKEEAVEQI
ncbi:MAG: family 20 glycosylhydrolase [Roseburia sp.]|nr:family 20 glycosylhydrolase [Roseburia sp.]